MIFGSAFISSFFFHFLILTIYKNQINKAYFHYIRSFVAIRAFHYGPNFAKHEIEFYLLAIHIEFTNQPLKCFQHSEYVQCNPMVIRIHQFNFGKVSHEMNGIIA